MFALIAAGIRSIYQSKNGAVAIQIALLMPVLIGMAALAIDIGFVLFEQRHMQSAADGAAFSAAMAQMAGHPIPISTEAYAVAAADGFVNGANGVTVTVNTPAVSPPASAADAANPSTIQVIIQQPQTLPLVGALCSLVPGSKCSGTFNVAAQAVAIGSASCTNNCGCILQTDPNAPTGLSMSNGVTVNLTQCSVSVNAIGSAALSVIGGATLNAPAISIAGGVSVNNGAQINGQGSCSTNCSQQTGKSVSNPYTSETMPPSSGPSFSTTTYGQGRTFNLSPGVWSGNVSIANGATVTMQPGVYFVNGGNFSVGGGATLTGTGVTIVLTSANGTVTIDNGATVNLTAPTSGATAGIAFFGNPLATESNINNFAGGSSTNITGVLYFPTQTVHFSNGSSSSCTQLIAGMISVVGGTTLKNTSCPAGIRQIGGGSAMLIE